MLQGLWHLAGGVDVELALEDVVDDRLAEVIHNVSIPVLQGQSRGAGEEECQSLRGELDGPFPGIWAS